MSHEDPSSIRVLGLPVSAFAKIGGIRTIRRKTPIQVKLVDTRRTPTTPTSQASQDIKNWLEIGLPAWKRARGFQVPKIPTVFSTKPGIPIERISEVPRAPVTKPRFQVPSLGQLTGGGPVITAPSIPAPPPAVKEPPVSLHKGLIKSIGTGLSGAITQRLGGQQKAIPIVGAAAGAAGRVLPAIGRVLGSRTVAAGSAGLAIGSLFGGGGGGACASGTHPNKQDGVGGPAGSYCVRNRRMNFGNARAARRSVRRLKGARKLLRDIERMMPTKTRTKTVKVPVHHDHHGHH